MREDGFCYFVDSDKVVPKITIVKATTMSKCEDDRGELSSGELIVKCHGVTGRVIYPRSTPGSYRAIVKICGIGFVESQSYWLILRRTTRCPDIFERIGLVQFRWSCNIRDLYGLYMQLERAYINSPAIVIKIV